MLGIEVELLTGRYIATAYNDREAAEWPPHPARLFSALVDTWASELGDEPGSGAGEEERMALIWLEQQAAPELAASASSEVGWRDVAPVFVPVNDTSVIRDPDAARKKLAEAEAAASAAADARDAADAKDQAKDAKDQAKDQAKANKNLDKLRKKLADDTAKATAAPARSSASDLDAAMEIFPEHRGKQPRTFPSVTPAEPRVTFIWPEAPEPRLLSALARLASRMTRLGHSASLVAARVVESAATSTYVPDPDGEHLLRTVTSGQLDRLIAAHAQHRGMEPRVLPCAFKPYREGASTTPHPVPRTNLSDRWLVFARTSGPRLPSTSAVGVANLFRKALFHGSKTPLGEALSGHRPDGGAAEREHMAIVPLPDVGSAHSHGGILGIALVLPRDLSDADRGELLRAIGELEQRHRTEKGLAADDAPALTLLMGEAGELTLERVVWGEHKTRGLRPGTWCQPWHSWATVTPIALDRNPGDLHDDNPARRARAFEEATELVASAVRRSGLPAPAAIDVVRSCVVPGTMKPKDFPRFPISRDRPQRVLVHARLVFAEPVRGPILLGAGRYLGLGLCRPLWRQIQPGELRAREESSEKSSEEAAP